MLKGTSCEAWIASPLTTFIHLFCKEPPWNESNTVVTLFPDGDWVLKGINMAFIKKHKDIEVPALLWPFWRGISTVEGIFQLYDISVLFLELPMVFHVILDQLSQRGKLLSPVEVIVVTCVLDLDVGDSSSSSEIGKRRQKNSLQVSWSIKQSLLYSVMPEVEKSTLTIPALNYCRGAELLPLCFSFSAHQPGRTGEQFQAGGILEGRVNPAASETQQKPLRPTQNSTHKHKGGEWEEFSVLERPRRVGLLLSPEFHQLLKFLPQEIFAFACCHSLEH